MYNVHKETLRKLSTFPLVGLKATGFVGEKSARLKKQFMSPVTLGNETIEGKFFVITKLIRECIIGRDIIRDLKFWINIADFCLYNREHNFKIPFINTVVSSTTDDAIMHIKVYDSLDTNTFVLSINLITDEMIFEKVNKIKMLNQIEKIHN